MGCCPRLQGFAQGADRPFYHNRSHFCSFLGLVRPFPFLLGGGYYCQLGGGMMEVFLATTRYEPPLSFRSLIAGAVRSCWIMLGAVVHEQYDHGEPDFQRTRRIEADERANDETYIVADDDCLPIGLDFIPCVLHLARLNQGYGIFSPEMVREKRTRSITGASQVFRWAGVGGIRICRKGIIKDWPEQTRKGYDREHCDTIKRLGLDCGIMRNVEFNHLGEGWSKLWYSYQDQNGTNSSKRVGGTTLRTPSSDHDTEPS